MIFTKRSFEPFHRNAILGQKPLYIGVLERTHFTMCFNAGNTLFERCKRGEFSHYSGRLNAANER